MKLKIGDKVRNKINGNIGIVNYLDGKEDINKISGFYRSRYGILYKKGQHLIFNTILEIEKIEEILDKYEKDYLSNVIKPFKDRVKCIYKKDSFTMADGEYIIINVSLPDNITRNNEIYYSILLPLFKKNTMYKKMENYRKYTLKELNLD